MKDDIATLLDEMTRLGRTESSPDPATRRAAQRDMRATAAKLTELRSQARNEFSAERGWNFSPDLFSHDYPVLDHVDHYLDAKKRLAGIVTHSYAPLEVVLQYAQRNGMRATELPFSSYNPDGCIAVLLESPTGAWRRPIRRHENAVRFEPVAA
jgi:hypothetical protein